MNTSQKIQQILSSTLPVCLALLVGYVIIWIAGYNPTQAYGALLQGAVGSNRQVLNTLFAATPLIFTGLATAISFKAGLYNMGSEGQLYLGAFFAAYIGFTLKGLPPLLHVTACLVGGACAGVLFALIPAVIKAYCDVDEMVSTLMLNYVAILLTTWLASYPFRAAGSPNPETNRIDHTAVLPRLSETAQLQAGFLLALIVFLAVFLLLNKTVLGYHIASIGKNRDFSQFVGMNVAPKIVLIMAISGMIAGFGGAVEVLGTHEKFVSGFSADYGWTGLTIALIGRYNPLGVFAGALLFGVLKNGGSTMEIMTGVPRSLISIIEGLIVLFFTVELIERRTSLFSKLLCSVKRHTTKQAKGAHLDG